MKTPRRWMALAAAIALLTLLLLPVERAAAAGIKFWTPPNEEYFGDPDIPYGSIARLRNAGSLSLTTRIQVLLILHVSQQARHRITTPEMKPIRAHRAARND